MKEKAIDFYTDLFCKIWFLVDFFVVPNQANYQDYSGIYDWGRHAFAEVILEPHGSFTLERHLVIYLACKNIRFSSLLVVGDVRNVPSGEERGETDVSAGYHLSRGNFCQSMSLFNKPCCLWSSSSQGTFSAIGTHHVGFHLSPFTDLLCIHGYHATLYSCTFMKRPPISKQPSFIKRLVIKVPK